jgi:hypothetical protein
MEGEGEKYACGVDVVDDFIAREESEEVGVGFEGVDGRKDVLEVDCVIRIGRIVSVKRIGRCVN